MKDLRELDSKIKKPIIEETTKAGLYIILTLVGGILSAFLLPLIMLI